MALTMQDIQLLSKETDSAGMERLFAEYFPRVYNFVYYHVMDCHKADDLTAEVFYRAFRSFRSYDPNKSQPYTWLCAIARNAVIDYRRRTAGIVMLDIEEHEELSDHSPGPEEAYLQKEETDTLLRLIHTLTPPEQELLLLKYFMGLTNREIAAQTGLSETNVSTKLSRIIAQLRKRFNEAG